MAAPQAKKSLQGTGSRHRLPRDQWHTLILDAHPGYITWAEYEENLARLRSNSAAYGADGASRAAAGGTGSAPGPGHLRALRRTHDRPLLTPGTASRFPSTSARAEGIKRAEPPCQRVMGADDRPGRRRTAGRVHDPTRPGGGALGPGRAGQPGPRKPTGCAASRSSGPVMKPSWPSGAISTSTPTTVLVAATLEAEWNNKLRALDAAQDDYERQRASDTLLDEEKRQRILALATDFPRLWRDPETPARERKRMARLLIEDVTLLRGDEVARRHVRFRGGDARSLQLPASEAGRRSAQAGPGHRGRDRPPSRRPHRLRDRRGP